MLCGYWMLPAGAGAVKYRGDLAAAPWMPIQWAAMGCSATAQASRCVCSSKSMPGKMHRIAGDFIADHCNSTTIKQLEFGPEPTALGKMTDLAFMGTNNKVWFLCCGFIHQSQNDLPSHGLRKVCLGLRTLL